MPTNGIKSIFTAIQTKNKTQLKKYAKQALLQAIKVNPLETSADRSVGKVKQADDSGYWAALGYDA